MYLVKTGQYEPHTYSVHFKVEVLKSPGILLLTQLGTRNFRPKAGIITIINHCCSLICLPYNLNICVVFNRYFSFIDFSISKLTKRDIQHLTVILKGDQLN